MRSGSGPLALLLYAALQGRAAEGRQIFVDLHGHTLAHDPPLQRDTDCAPALWSQWRKHAGPAADPAAADSITTSLDGALQAAALRAVRHAVERLARVSAPADLLYAEDPRPLQPGQHRIGTILRVGADALQLRIGALPGGEAVVGTLPLPAPARCEGHPAAPAPAPGRFRVGERLRVRVSAVASGEVRLTLRPEAALVALDPLTRELRALVGGYGQRPGDFDRASAGLRQAGSTWKPLLFAAALGGGRSDLREVFEDLPRVYPGAAGALWTPRNFHDAYRGPVRLREAFAHSSNAVAVQLLRRVGPAPVRALADQLGVPAAQVPLDLTQALGTAQVTPLALAAAYATFADTRGGRYAPPRLFTGGLPAPPAQPVLSPALAYLMSSLMRSVVLEGSAAAALARLRALPLHGKTGTSQRGADAWFAGYHSALVAVAWVGDDEPASQAERTGADAAVPLWAELVESALALGYAPQPLPRPPGLVEVPLPEGGTELLLAPPALTSAPAAEPTWRRGP